MLVANGLQVYKLRSLSDLPGLILQVAGTQTHGVLVSVSVSAVVCTRILVSDRIGTCPYRWFSSLLCCQIAKVLAHLWAIAVAEHDGI